MSSPNNPEDFDDLFMEFTQKSDRPEKNSPDQSDSLEEGLPPPMEKALNLALGDTPLLCPSCDEFCYDHIILVRDHIIQRAEHLTLNLLSAIDLYKRSREFGIEEPGQVLDTLYRYWESLVDLYDVSEPQEFIGTEGGDLLPEE